MRGALLLIATACLCSLRVNAAIFDTPTSLLVEKNIELEGAHILLSDGSNLTSLLLSLTQRLNEAEMKLDGGAGGGVDRRPVRGPVGTIIDWWRPPCCASLTIELEYIAAPSCPEGVVCLAIPAGYLEANGQVVAVQGSPLFGVATPDLRGLTTIGTASSSLVGERRGGERLDTSAPATLRAVPGRAQAGTSTSITLQASGGNCGANDACNGWILRFTAGTGAGQQTRVLDYVHTTKIATIEAVGVAASSDTDYELAPRAPSGKAAAGSSTTITLRSGFDCGFDEACVGSVVTFTAGSGAGQSSRITKYVQSTRVATIESVRTAPDATTQYSVSASPRFSSVPATQATIADFDWAGITGNYIQQTTSSSFKYFVKWDTSSAKVQAAFDQVNAYRFWMDVPTFDTIKLICVLDTFFWRQGVQTAVTQSSLVGWTACYVEYYNHSTTGHDIECGPPEATKMMIAAKPSMGASTLSVAAMGSRAAVLSQTYSTQLATAENGAFFYRVAGKSFGFASEVDIELEDADLQSGACSERLSWHLDNPTSQGGFRVGCQTAIDPASTWVKMVFWAQ
ncbi:hypothetical protein T484DRAFT_1982009 [Baffinella frigidus]|nr:hypothetical protein T484DRAFT_1982009 [Cryptophyta sp. CCMP2293]